MRQNILIVAATLLILPELTCAKDDLRVHDHQLIGMADPPDDPPIKITINPEARVSAVLVGALPSPKRCGTTAELSVKIINQAFVTSQLEAELVGDTPTGVTLDFHPEALNGIPEELRELHITLTNPGPTDLTIAFKSHHEIPDLGGRDRIHLLMHCLGGE